MQNNLFLNVTRSYPFHHFHYSHKCRVMGYVFRAMAKLPNFHKHITGIREFGVGFNNDGQKLSNEISDNDVAKAVYQ